MELYISVKKKDICISSGNEVRMDDHNILVNEFVSMRGNAMDFINYYIAKKSDDELYIDLLTNYKSDLWDMEYEDKKEDEEDFDSI